ncbi:hypothetical protein B4U79_15758 [Dinothrombium tinctorium]|uniref:Uncharacterized protein n=1 Tax=Dinothrombium tinctorium TaxID=1965070 RepID=A0A3S4RKU3_9ACAR|nr:hypothetical protein B4U79_15758 [Dinothrombium tinctorium]
MPCCGPRSSLCCLIISVWGIIMLSILGGLLYIDSIAFIEDLGIEDTETNPNATYENIKDHFEYAAYNCWIACGLYLVTFFISLQQFYSNKRAISS